MAETIDELTVEYYDGDKKVTEQLDKTVLTRGAWSTIMFLYRELDRKSGEFGPPKISIRRYRKSGGVFRYQSKFNISSRKQAYQIINVIKDWYPEDAEVAVGAPAPAPEPAAAPPPVAAEPVVPAVAPAPEDKTSS